MGCGLLLSVVLGLRSVLDEVEDAEVAPMEVLVPSSKVLGLLEEDENVEVALMEELELLGKGDGEGLGVISICLLIQSVFPSNAALGRLVQLSSTFILYNVNRDMVVGSMPSETALLLAAVRRSWQVVVAVSG